ncbi:hypothetical protein BTE77_34355 [Ensifer adhaerens]|nr:hypothetical protein BTE77_34355 [Ensifer adhaerens]
MPKDAYQTSSHLDLEGGTGDILAAADLKTELSLAYQPILDIRDNRVVSVEALARWNSKTLGTVSPGVFIPLAERLGRMQELTHALFEKALEGMQKRTSRMRLSFNLSAHDLSSRENVAGILTLLETSGLSGCDIDFEVTETAMLFGTRQAREAVALLRARGAGIVMDDFGAGHSSLSRLQELPFDKVKLDRHFMRMCNERHGREVLKAMIGMFRALETPLVVEGIETAQDLCLLNDLGATLVQGFYIARPMQQEQLFAWLHARSASERAFMRATA